MLKRFLTWLKWIMADVYDAECTKAEFVRWAATMNANNVNVGDVITIQCDGDVRFKVKIR